jgi:hypothetical protein
VHLIDWVVRLSYLTLGAVQSRRLLPLRGRQLVSAPSQWKCALS